MLQARRELAGSSRCCPAPIASAPAFPASCAAETQISAGLEVCSVRCSQKMEQHRKSSNAKSLAYLRALSVHHMAL